MEPVVAWGATTTARQRCPAGLNNVVAIAAGGYHSLALTSDGTVVAWGRNYEGQTTMPIGAEQRGGDCGGWLSQSGAKSDGTRGGAGGTTAWARQQCPAG